MDQIGIIHRIDPVQILIGFSGQDHISSGMIDIHSLHFHFKVLQLVVIDRKFISGVYSLGLRQPVEDQDPFIRKCHFIPRLLIYHMIVIRDRFLIQYEQIGVFLQGSDPVHGTFFHPFYIICSCILHDLLYLFSLIILRLGTDGSTDIIIPYIGDL